MIEIWPRTLWTPEFSNGFKFAFALLFMALTFRVITSWSSRFRMGQAAWDAGAPAQDVLSAISRTPLAFGEFGYRLRLLESTLRWSLGERQTAWRLARSAHLARLSPIHRLAVGAFLAWASRHEGPRVLRWGRFLLRRVPEMPHLRHVLGRVAFRQGGEISWGWDLWVGTVTLAQDDPLLLQDLMLSALEQIDSSCQHPVHLGHQAWSPQAPYIFEASLQWLLHRHGAPRSPWDRTAPARHLLQKGRPLEALALARTVPQVRRSQMLCEVEAMALNRIGDFPGAWAALEASLKEHSQSFRLWMERFQGALRLGNPTAARESLDMAARCLPPEATHPTVLEWRLHRAAFAHRVDQDPDRAWTLLASLPTSLQVKNTHLLAQVLIALERFEEAQERLQTAALRQQPDLELRLLQAECMAGLSAWEALIPFLEGLPQEARERFVFWHFRGLAWAHLNDPSKAQADLEAAAQLAPRNLRVILDAGHASAELGDHGRAEARWRQALRLAPDAEEALYEMACTLHAQHDSEGARRFLRECLIHHPDHESAQAFLAELETN